MKKITTYFLAFILFSSAVVFLGSGSTSDYSTTDNILQCTQTKVTTVYITGLDSLETRSPNLAECFDASLFNNPDDSVTVTLQQSGANTADSGLYTLLGTFDGVTFAVIDTLSSAGSSLCQRRLTVTEAGKLTFPYWGVKAVMSDGSSHTLTAYFMNTRKQQRVVVDTTL